MNNFGLELVTAPTEEPVTLEQAKSHLRVDYDDDDDLINVLITAAREMAEAACNRAFLSQTWRLSLDQFPCPASINTYSPIQRDTNSLTGYYDQYAIKLPLPRLQSVVSITYVDASGATQTLLPTAYSVDASSQPARIVPASGGTFPYPTSYVPGSVQVTFIAGSYTVVPASIQAAILLLIGHLYQNREATTELKLITLPLAVDCLLAPHKFYGGCG